MSNHDTSFLDFSTSSSYPTAGIVASRMCLVLERFQGIKDYSVPGGKIFEEAIAFFQQAQRNSVVSNTERSLVADVLSLMKSEGYSLAETAIQEFCDTAVTTLDLLRRTPSKVPPEEKEKLRVFFTFLERIVDQKAIRLTGPNS